MAALEETRVSVFVVTPQAAMEAGRKAFPPEHLRGTVDGHSISAPAFVTQKVAVSMRPWESHVRRAVCPYAATRAALKADNVNSTVLLGTMPAVARAATMSYLARRESVPLKKESCEGKSVQVPCFSNSCAQKVCDGPLRDGQYVFKSSRMGATAEGSNCSAVHVQG
jgi:hypothetical protein